MESALLILFIILAVILMAGVWGLIRAIDAAAYECPEGLCREEIRRRCALR